MEIIDVILLGILQGLTEFLPVSSSGHLVLGQYLLGIKSPGNTLEILFHIGTLGSVIFVLFDDIKAIVLSLNKKSTQKLILYITIATLPAVIIGLVFRHQIESLFESVSSVGFALCVTGVVLILSSRFKNQDSRHSFFSSIIIGLSQAVAIIPGISRSGFTISASLFLGFSAKESARFSFLLSIPIISGAGVLGILGQPYENTFSLDIILSALSSSFIIGVIALKFLIKLLELGKFYVFGIYCLGIGLGSIFI